MATFDFDLFPIYVAAQLLGAVQQDLMNASDEIHWYWRSTPSSSSCLWIDASWEMQRNQTIWKLGCLQKDTNTGSGIYLQSDALTESDFRQFFHTNLAILVDSSSTYSLAQMFARALQKHSSSTAKNENSMDLYFSDLQMTAAFPLVSETTGTHLEVAPVLLSRLQYTCPSPATKPPDTHEKEEDDVLRAFQTWKSQSLILKPKILSSPQENHASPTKGNKKKNQEKPHRKHGFAKVARPHRKPGLKFKGQG
jgi:hypothetical protein